MHLVDVVSKLGVQVTERQQPYYTSISREPTVAHQGEGDQQPYYTSVSREPTVVHQDEGDQQLYHTHVSREPTIVHQGEGNSWKNKVQAAARPNSGQVSTKAGPAAEKKPGVPQEGQGDILWYRAAGPARSSGSFYLQYSFLNSLSRSTFLAGRGLWASSALSFRMLFL